MMNRRLEILRATSEAARIFAEFPHGRRTSFDIVGAVTKRRVPLLFRPLDGLWGAFITDGRDNQGIIVTSRLGLPVQRFTLAHELGHLLLGHESSMDETVDFSAGGTSSSRPAAEVAADTFAAELLAPRRLILGAARRHSWDRRALRSPQNVYQLALRLGVSYKAACWALVSANALPSDAALALQGMPVRNQKRALASPDLMSHSWADVWSLSPADTGTLLEAGPDDLFAVSVQDHSSSGYLWQLVDTSADVEIVDERCGVVNDSYGQPFSRVVYVRFTGPGVHRLQFEHVRPWSKATAATIDIGIDTFGKEVGLPRCARTTAQSR